MSLLSPLQYAQHLVAEHVGPGDRVIDATVGNGKDTLFLSQTVGPSGIVYGFDIQNIALQQAARYLSQHIDRSRVLISSQGNDQSLRGGDVHRDSLLRNGAQAHHTQSDPQIILMQQSHAHMKQFIPSSDHGRIACVMFNLGYLPGGDHQLTTLPESTLPALDAALHLLKPGGLLTIMVYPGHPEGRVEAEQVNHWATCLPQQNYQVLLYQHMNQVNHPPYLISMIKK